MTGTKAEKFLTACEVAGILSYSVDHVRRLLRAGRIKYFRPPGSKQGEYRIWPSDLDAWIARGTSKTR